MDEVKDTYITGQVYEIPLSDIQANPNQPRRTFDQDALEALKTSISREGLLQPIAVLQTEEGKLVIAAGERRYRAVTELGWEKISCRIVEGSLDDLALMENMIREDLNPMERALAMQSYIDHHRLSRKKLSHILGIARNSISEILSLNKLPKDIQDIIIKDKRYSLHNMRVIARIKNEEEQREKFEKLKAKIEHTELPKSEKTKKPVFDLNNKRKRLERIVIEIKRLQNQFNKQELRQLKKEIQNLNEQLKALRYKIGDDIYVDDD